MTLQESTVIPNPFQLVGLGLAAFTLLLSGCSGGGNSSPSGPDAFSFAEQGDVAPNTVITSEAVTVTGLRGTLPITVSGGRYSIGCTDEYVATEGSIKNEQTVCLRHTSATGGDIQTETAPTIGQVTGRSKSVTRLDTETLGLLTYLDDNGELMVLDPTGIPTAVSWTAASRPCLRETPA